MLGDSSEDYLASRGAKWLNKMGIHVMTMSPDKKDYGHHSYPLERFGRAIEFMKSQGCEKIGVIGASTTGFHYAGVLPRRKGWCSRKAG